MHRVVGVMLKPGSLALVLVLCACATTAPEKAAPEAPSATIAEEPERAANEEMQFHFWDIAQARDAVIMADLPKVQAPLLRIAEGQYGDDLPVSWRDWIDDMQGQARTGARATSLPEAARAVANLSGTCAECHRATAAGPSLADDAPGYQARGAGLPERMHKHMWAAEALWAGLTAPQHQAWSRGARALASLPLPGEQAGDGPATGPFADKLDAIRNLGARADAAAQPAEKVAVYGEILVHCADCHAQVRAGG